MNLIYLKHNQIDKEKWDSTIENSKNALVYAMSWFLNIVSPNWEAVVNDDYSILMPITVRKKLGVKYFFKPVFIQYLGVFSKKEISEDIAQRFISTALQEVKFIDVWFNPFNIFTESNSFVKKQTQVLDLSSSYEILTRNYSRSNKSNLKKANNKDFRIEVINNEDILIGLLKEMYSKKNVEGVTANDFANLRRIIEYANNHNIAEFITVFVNNEPCSAAFFIRWNYRVIIFHAANDLGRENRSMFILVDEFIKNHSGQNILFDFAGSNIKGVAEWNLGFGASNVNYYSVQINNLPTPFKWLKK